MAGLIEREILFKKEWTSLGLKDLVAYMRREKSKSRRENIQSYFEKPISGPRFVTVGQPREAHSTVERDVNPPAHSMFSHPISAITSSPLNLMYPPPSFNPPTNGDAYELQETAPKIGQHLIREDVQHERRNSDDLLDSKPNGRLGQKLSQGKKRRVAPRLPAPSQVVPTCAQIMPERYVQDYKNKLEMFKQL